MANQIKRKTSTKKTIVNAIAEENKVNPKDVHQVVQAFLDKVTETLGKRERIEFREFGVFEVVVRKKKIGRNPKKASIPIEIPAHLAIKFTPGKKMALISEKRN